jgi:hypothetical protein
MCSLRSVAKVILWDQKRNKNRLIILQVEFCTEEVNFGNTVKQWKTLYPKVFLIMVNEGKTKCWKTKQEMD